MTETILEYTIPMVQVIGYMLAGIGIFTAGFILAWKCK